MQPSGTGPTRVKLTVPDDPALLHWREEVEQAIEKAARFLLLWSERAAVSRWVLMEVQLARRLRK